ncbi:MAG: o-succinylbenzoate synthase [Bryobacteraceae bacterium]|nr:o-succinylbenzoate synthase [Bryobacteraceae bacterium]
MQQRSGFELLASFCGPIRPASIELRRVSIPMTEPFRISSGEVASKDALLVRLADGPHFGWGESSAMPGGFYSAETPDSCWEELAGHLLPAICGQTFESITDLAARLADTGFSRFATVAVETAAWELVARARGVTLHDLFGIRARPVASGLAVGLYENSGALWSAVKRFEFEHYKRLKIKIKRGHDVQLVRAMREMMPGFPLFVDANADYSLADLDVFLEMDRFGLLMFEQPFAGADLEGLAELQRRLRTPVCIDESADSADQVRRAIEMGACRIVNIKLQRVGGFLEAMRILDVCAAHGVPVWMGTMPELGIGSAHALALAAHPQFAYPTDVEPSRRWYADDIVTPEIVLRNGFIDPPSGGYQIDPDKLARYTLECRRWDS